MRFQPCGHWVVCADCYEQIRTCDASQRRNKCPTCRAHIERVDRNVVQAESFMATPSTRAAATTSSPGASQRAATTSPSPAPASSSAGSSVARLRSLFEGRAPITFAGAQPSPTPSSSAPDTTARRTSAGGRSSLESSTTSPSVPARIPAVVAPSPSPPARQQRPYVQNSNFVESHWVRYTDRRCDTCSTIIPSGEDQYGCMVCENTPLITDAGLAFSRKFAV